MIDHSHSTAATNLVAIDGAKEWNVALVHEPCGRRRSFKFANRRADHDEFVTFLHSLDGQVQVGLEPTGDFHRNIAYRLLSEGFPVVSISSLALARFREARFGTWDKNDPKDAQVILAMMMQGMVQVYWDPLYSGTHDWQELSNTYFQITLARTRLQHSLLLHHLPLYFPEFTRYWNSTRSEWFIRFLHRFPTPASIRVLDREAFIAEAWSSHRLKKRRGPSGRSEHYLRGRSRLNGPCERDRSTGKSVFEKALIIRAMLDHGVRNAGHLGGDGGQGFAFAVRVQRHRAHVAFILIAKSILALMNRYQSRHPECQSKPLVATLGKSFAPFVLARLALGQVQPQYFRNWR